MGHLRLPTALGEEGAARAVASGTPSPDRERCLGLVTLHPDEVPVEEDTVRGLLSAQRPDLAGLPVAHLGGGTDNTLYRIGEEHLARLPRTRGTVASLEKELTWLPRLRPHLAHPIPTPVHAGRPGPGYPLSWAIYTWIDGQEPSAGTVADWARYGRDLARFVERLHTTDLMGATRSGDLAWYRGGPLRPQDGWVSSSFADVRRHGPDLDVDRLETLWRQALELPEPAGPHVWLHGDLRPTNVLVRDGLLHAAIDFGALSVGHPDAEHAVVWDLPPAARDAYRRHLDLDDLTWARAGAWAVAVGISGVAYYWSSFPSFVAECLHRLRAIAADPG